MARLGDTGRMVVGEDDRGGIVFESAFHDLAGVDARLRQGAPEELLEGRYAVLRVEQQHDLFWPVPSIGHPGTPRLFEGGRFHHPDGKARFHAMRLPNLAGADRRLRLMTIRSEGQFNTVVYEEEDIYRGQDRRDVILINPDDMQRLGLTPDRVVTVRSAAGELRRRVVRPYDIRPGNAAMYYPEANVLVPRDVDPRSKTPAFKSVLVEVVPS